MLLCDSCRAAWGRELQAWVPDADDDSALLSLEGDSGGTGWDQFAVNREKFGVESTFDEHIYTTRIDRKNCAISEEEAERLAREIEGGFGSTTANLHQLEERGIMGDDTGVGDLGRTIGSGVLIRGGTLMTLGCVI